MQNKIEKKKQKGESEELAIYYFFMLIPSFWNK